MQLIKLKDKFNKHLKLDSASPSGLSSRLSGKPIGALTDRGYYRVSTRGISQSAHRIVAVLAGIVDAHKLKAGSMEYQVDHVNGDRSDNRPENLRVVTNRANHQNKVRHRAGCLVGAYQTRYGTYASQIRIDGRQRHIGTYKTEVEAHQAYTHALLMHQVSRALTAL